MAIMIFYTDVGDKTTKVSQHMAARVHNILVLNIPHTNTLPLVLPVNYCILQDLINTRGWMTRLLIHAEWKVAKTPPSDQMMHLRGAIKGIKYWNYQDTL